MLAWLQSIDTALFRFINGTMSCPALDPVMRLFDGNPVFAPAILVLAVLLCWKGGRRGRLFVLLITVIILMGDILLIGPLKHAVGRLRPFHEIPDALVLAGRGDSGSMPSSHTSSWFAATFIAYAFYPRTLWLMLPLAITMAFSRVYVGVHYPGDALVGAIVGAGYAAALLWTLETGWQRVGQSWFPIWWRNVPSLLGRQVQVPVMNLPRDEAAQRELQFLRLGYLLIGVFLGARLWYIASGRIELSEDEAYQWLWSKNLALSYWSKPPLIAYTQWLGTNLWGDTAFGVRFFSPVFAAVTSLLLLRFMARVANARLALLLLLVITAAPMMSGGSVLLTVDPLLVMFWTAAMIAGWRAAQPEGTTANWLWVGLWMGLAFLSKYTALFQIGCWAVFFALWKPARVHLRKPGPWLALGVFAVCTLPVAIWNAQHDWVTAQHVSTNAKLDEPWHFTLEHMLNFLAQEAVLLHPIFLLGALWAMFSFWKRYQDRPLMVYFFAMGAPVFLGYWLFTLHSEVKANWIAAAVVPMFCLMAVYWEQRWQEGAHAVKWWLFAALGSGFLILPLLHDTDLTKKVAGNYLPAGKDPMRRVRGIKGISEAVASARQELLRDGREVFLLTSHYGVASQVTFYMPEAREGLPGKPLAYPRIGKAPRDQFFFWPHYRYREQRKGQNAIFFKVGDKPPPAELKTEFESVTPLGVVEVKYRRRVFHRVQLFACRNLL